MKLIDHIAGNIEKRRGKMSIDKLSKKADIPFTTLMNIKRKQVQDVRASTLIAIAKALGCSLDELVG
ncbi:MAG: helix-turn-helix transcriptional regulator [Candidatus Margulisiibacteriota bacterium]|jgi:DNA-binding Xre family transcriptional regulator